MRIFVIYLSILALLMNNLVFAYCPSAYAKIDSIEPNYSCLDINDRTKFCGGSIEIINHCQDSFYFYDKNDQLFKGFLMINTDEFRKNYEHYKKMGKDRGIAIRGSAYRSEPEYNIGMATPKDAYKDGEVLKEWVIKLRSVENEKDIIVKGRTVYEKPNTIRNTTIMILGVLSLIGFGIAFFLAILSVLYKWQTTWYIVAVVLGVSIILNFLSLALANMVG